VKSLLIKHPHSSHWKRVSAITTGVLVLVLTFVLSYVPAKRSVRVQQLQSQALTVQDAGSLSYVPSAKEATNWRVYSNPALGFSIEYPPNWAFSEDTAASPEDRTIYFFDAQEALDTTYHQHFDGISIRSRQNDHGLSLDQWADRLYFEMSGGLNPPQPLPKHSDRFAGYSSVRVTGIPSRQTELYIFLAYERRILAAGLELGSESVTEQKRRGYEGIMLVMLSTFRAAR
jgi:hypothetical protein